MASSDWYHLIMRKLAAILVFSLAAASTLAQGTVLSEFRKLGEKGIPNASAPSSSPTAFKPSSSHPGIDLLLKDMEMKGDEAAQMKSALADYVVEFSKEAGDGFGNDASGGLGATLAILKALSSGDEMDEASTKKFIGSVKSALNTSAVKGASDADKQEAYDYAVAAGGLAVILVQASKESEAGTKMKQIADLFSLLLVKAPASQIKVTGGTLSLEGVKKTEPVGEPKTENTGGGMAANFTYSKPADWAVDGVWNVYRYKDSPQDTNITSAMIRFLPSVSKSKNGGEILAGLWKTAVPTEIPMGGMVYRRYVGDRVPAWFVTGKAKEKGRQADSYFTLMIVDCGKSWQPLVIAQTYEDNGQYTAGVEMSAGFSYGKSADFAEKMLSTFRCADTAGTPIADRASIAGTLHYGNYASMDYIHLPTGATSTSYVTYGGSYTFNANGSFTYAYSSASSSGGGASFGKIDGKGTWTVEGDKLVAKFSEFKQYVSSGGFPSELKNKVYVYMIGGVTTFGDGTKIVILIEVPPAIPVNAVTVGDRGNWYTTKKKD